MSVLSLRKAAVTTPPPQSSERAALAAAIAAHREAQEHHAALVAADQWDGSAATAEHAARRALEAAEAGLAQAKADAATSIVNGTQAPGLTMREARAALQEAQDCLDVATMARETIRERLDPTEGTVRLSRMTVETCVADVLRTEAPATALLADLDRLFKEIVDKGHLLELLTGPNRIPRNGPASPLGTSYALSMLSLPPMSWTLWNAPQMTLTADNWKAALEKLKKDASTPLPGV